MWFHRRRFFYVFPIVSLWQLMTPGAGPFLTPGAWLAGFIKRTTTHCYIQNMKALGLVVSEKKMFFLRHLRGGARMDPSGTVGRIYKEDHYTLLHTKYESSGPCGFGEEDFLKFFPWHLHGGARMDPSSTVGRIYKEEHYNYIAINKIWKLWALWFRKRRFFLCFAHDPPGRGPYGPQGHGWQDL